MKATQQNSGLIFITMILSLTLLIIMGSGLYLWFAVPEQTALKINGEEQSMSKNHLLGTVLQTTLSDEE